MVRAEDAEHIFSAGPSFAHGGRYNRRGEFGAVYFGESAKVCEQEKLRQVAGQADWLPPQMVGEVDADIHQVVDLTNSKNLKTLGLTRDQLTDPMNLTLPQALAEAARHLGVRAMLVPSAVCEGKNLVVFEEHLLDPACRLKLAATRPW